MPNANDRLVGDVLDGRYEIIDRAGRGGMATVYKAKDRRLDRIVAVKVMREDWEDDPEYAHRFDAEARAVANLSDAHIVSVFDQGIDRGRPYIVMEYVEGTNLKAVMVQQGAMPPRRALRLLEDIAAGLAAAHSADIVHRDVKPENVLLSPSGEVKVTDFGLARQAEAQTMTVADGVLGSLSYVSPERLLHQAPVDFRSDIYSTGVLAFEMLTGHKPFTGDTAEIVSAHLNKDVPPPSAIMGRSAIPAWLDALVVACGSRDADARPYDGRDLLRRIRVGMEALASGRDDPDLIPIMTARSGGIEPLTPPASPIIPTTAPAALVAHEDTPELVNDDLVVEPPPEPPSPREAMFRRRRIFASILTLIVLLGAGVGAWWLASGRFTTVPDLANHTPSQAASLISGAGLQLTTTDAFDETVPAGSVISTDPIAGTRVPRGSTVAAVVSKGPERYAVPTLEGLSLEDAKTALTDAHLSVGGITSEYSDTVEAGMIVHASQPVGTLVKPGTAIDLVVSQGPTPVLVVDYTGQPADVALQALTAAGLAPTQQQTYSSTVPAGLVVQQTPNSGTLAKGDAVVLIVSQGPQMVMVPNNLVGSSTNDAKATLTGLGLKVSIKPLTADVVRLDIVSSTDPPAGTTVASGSTVTLYVV